MHRSRSKDAETDAGTVSMLARYATPKVSMTTATTAIVNQDDPRVTRRVPERVVLAS